jgi:hypothetical protein
MRVIRLRATRGYSEAAETDEEILMLREQGLKQPDLNRWTRLAVVGTVVMAMAFPGKRAEAQTNAVGAGAAANGLWRQVVGSERADAIRSGAGMEASIQPENGAVFAVDDSVLTRVLARAPREHDKPVRESVAIITLPRPDGSFERFAFVESPIMAPALQARYPEIRTYLGQGLDNPAATARFDVTPQGLHAQVFAPGAPEKAGGPAYAVDPMWRGDITHHLAHRRVQTNSGSGWDCSTPQGAPPAAPAARAQPQDATNLIIRYEFRLALATTGEYTTFVSAPNPPTVAAGLSAVVTAINRVNQIYEADLAVRLILVDDEDQFIFTDPATDPYSGQQADMQNQNQSMLDSFYLIHSGGYDIGHMFDQRVVGGNAGGIGTVCVQGSNGKGFTGSGSPTSDSFWVDYVAHEMGHQLGATHTFNGNGNACGPAWTSYSAYEPGSGTSIMGYAGICSTDDITSPAPPNGASVPMFSFDSIQRIHNDIYSFLGDCADKVTTSNHLPTVTPFVPNSWIVPTSTPFRLLGSWSDEDFGDIDGITGSWEQADLGPQLPLGPDTGQNEPLFRVFMHNHSGERVFPQWSDILGNVTTKGEYLPLYSRSSSKYRFVVRDNAAGGGGTATNEVTIQFVAGSSGGFRVTGPTGGGVYCAGSPLLVIWNTAGTENAPVSCSEVDITLSYDNGQTFPITVRANAPNVGLSNVTIPGIPAENARIMVSAVDNIFFAVNSAAFAVVAAPPTIESQSGNVSVCPGQTIQMDISAGGGEHRSFQWYKNAVLIPGETIRLYGRNHASHDDTGDYTCVVSNVCGQVTSTPIRVQVGVSFDSQPAPLNLTPCQNALFTVAARGVGTLSYQWCKDGVPLVNGGRVSGVSTPALLIANVRYEDEASYDCLVTDSCETFGCNPARLTLPTPTWVRRSTTGPLQRGFTSDVAYDALRRVAVLYGGYGALGNNNTGYLQDTWEWDGIAWTQRFPPHNPDRRIGQKLVFDTNRKVVLLVGGSGVVPPNNEVWAYDGYDWTLLTPSSPAGPPDNSIYEYAVFDSVRGKLILLTSIPPNQNGLQSATWEFDSNTLTWTLAASGMTIGYYESALGYDSVRHNTVGQNYLYPNNALTAATWIWNGALWANAGIVTPAREAPCMAFDTERRRMVLYGCCRGSGPGFYTTDTWAFDGTAWQQILAGFNTTQLDAVIPFALVYDSARRTMVMIGKDYSGSFGDVPMQTWEYRYLDGIAFDRQPQAQTLTPGGTANFTVYAAGYGTLSYQWKRNGQNLANGPAPGGGTTAGAQANVLTLTGVQEANGGIYTCQVSNDCGGALSNGALLGTPVPPDFDGDGDVDDADREAFEACSSGPAVPLAPGCDAQDLDRDNDVDQSDFAVFQRCYSGENVLADPDCAN